MLQFATPLGAAVSAILVADSFPRSYTQTGLFKGSVTSVSCLRVIIRRMLSALIKKKDTTLVFFFTVLCNALRNLNCFLQQPFPGRGHRTDGGWL